MKKIAAFLFFSLVLTGLSAQTKTSLIDFLGKAKQSKEISAFMGKFKDWENEQNSERSMTYKSPSGGIVIETLDDTVYSISVFQEGEVYHGTEIKGYKGELPYGLKMNMLRGAVVNLLGEPEVIDGFSETDFAVEMTGTYPSKKIRLYYYTDDDAEGKGWKDPKDRFLSITLQDFTDEYSIETEDE